MPKIFKTPGVKIAWRIDEETHALVRAWGKKRIREMLDCLTPEEIALAQKHRTRRKNFMLELAVEEATAEKVKREKLTGDDLKFLLKRKA